MALILSAAIELVLMSELRDIFNGAPSFATSSAVTFGGVETGCGLSRLIETAWTGVGEGFTEEGVEAMLEG